MLKKGTSHRILVNLNEFSEFFSNWYFWWKSRRAWQMWSWDQLMANDSITSAKILLTLASHHHAVGTKRAAHFIPWKGSWNQGADADCEACNRGNVSHRNCSVCCHHLRLVFQIFKTIPGLNHGLSWRILLWILFVRFSSCFIPYIFFTSHLPTHFITNLHPRLLHKLLGLLTDHLHSLLTSLRHRFSAVLPRWLGNLPTPVACRLNLNLRIYRLGYTYTWIVTTQKCKWPITTRMTISHFEIFEEIIPINLHIQLVPKPI